MPFDNPHHSPIGDVDLLLDARRLISDRRDWVQGRFQDGNRRCLVAALSSVSGSRDFDAANRVERRLTRLLARQLLSRPFWSRLRSLTARRRLIWFNDDRRTKHEDVIALFDCTIDELTRGLPVCVSR
jgi:hypothetical protein